MQKNKTNKKNKQTKTKKKRIFILYFTYAMRRKMLECVQTEHDNILKYFLCSKVCPCILVIDHVIKYMC